ncbi:hypothetical protein BFP78_15550 [Gaetbulibacter sp. 5U11]|nr:hypothetical protein BFP78_15550 [Gaetbulibacter sp. 5U11]
MKKLLLSFLIISLASCKAYKEIGTTEGINRIANKTVTAMKGYQPIDPIRIKAKQELDSIGIRNIINELPNEATRIAIGKIELNGSISFGPFNVAKSGETYTVIVDYIKYITTSIPAEYSSKYSQDEYRNKILTDYNETLDYFDEQSPTEEMLPKIDTTKIGQKEINKYIELRTNHGSVSEARIEKFESVEDLEAQKKSLHKIKIPVYVGVGLRIQASVTVLKDSLDLNLGSLYGLGVAASRNQLNGTLVIQTLGISGENISPALPIPDRINETTIQAAMQSLATIKSKIYDSKTHIIPQVVAFGLPYSIEGAKDLLESTLHTEPPLMLINGKGEIDFEKIELKENE